MNSLPIELQAYIGEILSEQDNGVSIRALSLVSSLLHEICRPYLYRRVAVSGATQIAALANQLKDLPPNHRGIRQLFLSDSPLHEPHNGIDEMALISRSVTQILSLASISLISLTAYLHSQRGPSLIARILRTRFPALRHLTISGLYPFPTSPSHFPLLRTLSLDGTRNPAGLLSVCGFSEVFPELESLNISGVEGIPFLMEVEEAVTPPSAEISTIPKLPSKLQHLTIKPTPKRENLPAIALLKYDVMMSQLEGLQTRAAGGGLKVHVLGARPRITSARDMWQEWTWE